MIEDALAERQAGATDVHHVIEVVDDLVYFTVVVSCIACHLSTKNNDLVFKCLSSFVAQVKDGVIFASEYDYQNDSILHC